MKTKTLQSKSSTASRSVKGEKQPFFRKAKSTAQAKDDRRVMVGPPNDKYEKEANALADQYSRQGIIPVAEQAPLYGQVTPLVQRENEGKAEENGEDEFVQARREEQMPVQAQVEEAQTSSDEMVQAQPGEVQASANESLQPRAEEDIKMHGNRPSARSLNTQQINQLKTSKGQGESMSPQLQQKTENFFGADFSRVRIHTDERAHLLNIQLGAKAFTHGRDVYFRKGAYKPEQDSGQNLIVHELTHTIQQGTVPAKKSATEKTETKNTSDGEELPGSSVPSLDQEVKDMDSMAPVESPVDVKDAIPSDEPAIEPLPEAKAPVEQEEVATVNAAELSGSSDESLQQFTTMSPSVMAATQPGLGQALMEKMGNEQKEEAENVPELKIQTSGELKEGITKADELKMPGAEISSGIEGKDSGPQEIDPHHDPSKAPSNARAEGFVDKGDQQEKSGFLAWLQANMRQFMEQIQTTDPKVKTSAGNAPKVDTSGEADPQRMNTQREDAQTALQDQRDGLTQKFKDHPGQKNIQPKAIDERRKPKLSTEKTAEISTPADQGLQDFVNAPLPKAVRQKTDELLQPNLDANLSETRKNTQAAVNQRNTDKKAAVDQAKSDVKESNKKADQDQRSIVLENRKKVASEQQQGIADAHQELNNFNNAADGKQATAQKAINSEIKARESGAAKELKKGEDKAKSIKKEGEKKAKAKKAELKKAQKKKSWWDRVKSAVKRAVKAITAAIDKVFNWVREQVKKAIEAAKNAAIALINKARNFIKSKLEAFRNWAKSQVDKYLKDTFPGLAKRINGAIDTVVDAAQKGVDIVADAAIKTVEFVADQLSKALDKVLQVFQTAMKAAVQITGAILTGDLAEALRVAIQAACDIAGIKSKPIFDFIDRAKDQIMNILRNPLKFFGNLVEAVGGGVRGFFKRITTHLKKGLIGWLTGSISETGLTLPDKFDFKGIVSIALQVLGLTYANIKAKVIKRLPGAEKVFSGIEKGITIVGKIVKEGPIALWKEIKEKIGNFKQTVLTGIRDFVATTVVREGIMWLLGLLNPAAAIVKALKLIVDFILFLVDNFQRIIDFVKSVYNSLAAIASGALAKAQKAVEDSLSRILPIAISLLANLAGLRGIAKTVKKIIKSISKPVNKIIRRIVDKMVKLGKKLLKKGKKAAKKVKDKVVGWWKARKKFKTIDGKSHKLYFKGKGRKAKLMRASESPQALKDFLNGLKIKDTDPKAKAKKLNKKEALVLADQIQVITRTPEGKHKGTDSPKEKEITEAMNDLSRLLVGLIDMTVDDVPDPGIPSFTGLKSGLKHAKWEKMSHKSAKGGKGASGTSPEYKHVQGSSWVRMHMISAALGGVGDPKNWVPAPNHVNVGGSVLHSFENSADRLIRSKGIPASAGINPKPPQEKTANVLWMDVKVINLQPAPPGHDELTHFPNKMEFKYGIYLPPKPDANARQWTKVDKPLSYQKVTIPPATISDELNLAIDSGSRMIAFGGDFANPKYGERLRAYVKAVRKEVNTLAGLYDGLSEKGESSRVISEDTMEIIIARLKNNSKITFKK